METSQNSSQKLRVGFCHPDLGIGGAERLIVDMAVELELKGHDVQIFTSHYNKNRCFEETKNLQVSVYGDYLPRHVFGKFHVVCAYIRCLYVALVVSLFFSSFDVIIVDQVSAVIPIFKWFTKSKVFFYCHFPDLLLATRSTQLRRLYRAPIDKLEEWTTGMADELLVNSKFTSSIFASTFRSLSKRGVKPQILYPCVNMNLFTDLESELNLSSIEGISPEMPFFLSINRFERKKNISLAVEAFSLFLRGGFYKTLTKEKVKLVIAGGYDPRVSENKEYFEELKQIAEREQILENVIFLPSFSDDQKKVLLKNCLCVLYTPQNEHFGIVPLEAMAARKPVIACDSGGPTETVVDGKSGYLCPPVASFFSQAMEALLEANVASEMGQWAMDHVENNFSRSVFGHRLNSLLLQLVNQ